MVSDLGDTLVQLTLVLLINRITGGATSAIAYLLIAMALPHATVGLVAGVFVDRLDRKKTMITTDLIRGLLVLAFIPAIAVAQDQLWSIYTIAFLQSMASAFFTPARMAILPQILPKEGLLVANSLTQMTFVVFRVVGNAVAGILIGAFDNFWLAFVINALTFFGSMLFLSRIDVERAEIDPAKPTQSATIGVLLSELYDGLYMIAHQRVLLGTLIGTGITMLGLGAISVLLAPLVVNDLGVNEAWFGALEFAQAAGMVVSGSAVAILAARFRPTSIITVGLLFLGPSIAAKSLVHDVWYLFPIMFIVGLAATPLSAAVSTIIQSTVADEVRGRVSSSLSAVMQSANLVSMFVAGTAATVVGIRSTFIFSGVLIVSAAMLTFWAFRGSLVSAVGERTRE